MTWWYITKSMSCSGIYRFGMRRTAGRPHLALWDSKHLECFKSGLPGRMIQTRASLDSLESQLSKIIQLDGPISIERYMRLCLTHPEFGYYNQRPPFGQLGDFITSPEISQMFGELICIYFFTQWSSMCKPANISFFELGPGRGTLLDDLLRASTKFPEFLRAIKEIHLLEVSDRLRNEQKLKLCGKTPIAMTEGIYHASSKYGPEIYWHFDLATIPENPVCPFVLAHEFFDAIPILAFEKTQFGWRELLVELRNSSEEAERRISSEVNSSEGQTDKTRFHLAVSREPSTIATELETFAHLSKLPINTRIEVSPESLTIMRKIISMIKASSDAVGGSALIIDYGSISETPSDTLRGIKSHDIVSPFLEPGSVDLSADVDFTALANQARKSGGLSVYGPVRQRDWLHELGIEARTAKLVEKAKTAAAKDRIRGEYERLVERTGMGENYKVMAITAQRIQPVGFAEHVSDALK